MTDVRDVTADDEAFEDARPAPADDGQLVLDLDGFEGPIDVLLHLARKQKVDITRISVLALAEQYLAFVQDARRRRLDLAGDYLVMAAWLILLKARLLAPQRRADSGEENDDEGGEEMAAALRFQLRRVQAMREAGEALLARPRLGRAIFARGEPETETAASTVGYTCTLNELLQAYARQLQREETGTPLRVDPTSLWAIETARAHLESVLATLESWMPLESVLPPASRDAAARRSAIASTLAASLDLVREGRLDVRQDGLFGPVYLRTPAADDRGEAA